MVVERPIYSNTYRLVGMSYRYRLSGYIVYQLLCIFTVLQVIHVDSSCC